MTKRYLFASLAVTALILVGAGCVAQKTANEGAPPSPAVVPFAPAVQPSDTPIVGGDRDEHGCIGSAGYSWCASKNKCLRIWEEECPGATVNAPEPPSPPEPQLNSAPSDVDAGGAKAVNLEQACNAADGSVTSAMCCNSAADFPNSCLIGACGCSPANSHSIKICNCGEGRCFDGKTCVKR